MFAIGQGTSDNFTWLCATLQSSPILLLTCLPSLLTRMQCKAMSKPLVTRYMIIAASLST